MKLSIALAVSCQAQEMGELNLETSLAVETGGLTWQLQLEEVMVHRARQAARNLAQQVSAHIDPAPESAPREFVPLAESIRRQEGKTNGGPGRADAEHSGGQDLADRHNRRDR